MVFRTHRSEGDRIDIRKEAQLVRNFSGYGPAEERMASRPKNREGGIQFSIGKGREKKRGKREFSDQVATEEERVTRTFWEENVYFYRGRVET